MMRRVLTVIALGCAGHGSTAFATAETVKGRVEVTGQKTSANALISIEAPGLEYTPPAEPVKIDQKGFRFIPHITVIVPGTTVRFLNNDPEPHNVYSPEGRYNLGTWPTGETRDHTFDEPHNVYSSEGRYNLGTWPTGETRDHTFDEPGIYTQLCNIHPDMLAYVVVVETPYFAVSDAGGGFEVKGVPPGKYLLWAWHEKKDGLEQEIWVEPGQDLELAIVIER